MKIQWTLFCAVIALSGLSRAEDLPLPTLFPGPQAMSEPSGEMLRPMIIRPPLPEQGALPAPTPLPVAKAPLPVTPIESAVTEPSAPAVVAEATPTPPDADPKNASRELALKALERRLVDLQLRRKIAEAHDKGHAGELKHLIVVQGPVDTAVSQSAHPPKSVPGQIALVGVQDNEVSKSVEHFFGAPMTPDQEKALLETVKTQMANGDSPKQKSDLDVRIAGWWPAEGVMAVSVMPGKGS